MSDLLVSPNDVLTHLRATDSAVASLDAAIAQCTKIPDAQHTAWLNFRTEYTDFSNAKRKKWSSSLNGALLIFGPTGVIELDLRADDAKVLDYEHQIAGWQAIAKSTCGFNVPGLTPRDDPNNNPPNPNLKLTEHIAIAAAVVGVCGVGLVGFNYLRKFF